MSLTRSFSNVYVLFMIKHVRI